MIYRMAFWFVLVVILVIVVFGIVNITVFNKEKTDSFVWKTSFYSLNNFLNLFCFFQFYIGKKITDEEAYKRLTELRGQTDNSGFFPEYRA